VLSEALQSKRGKQQVSKSKVGTAEAWLAVLSNTADTCCVRPHPPECTNRQRVELSITGGGGSVSSGLSLCWGTQLASTVRVGGGGQQAGLSLALLLQKCPWHTVCRRCMTVSVPLCCQAWRSCSVGACRGLLVCRCMQAGFVGAEKQLGGLRSNCVQTTTARLLQAAQLQVSESLPKRSSMWNDS
jgi:hypothetical protein